MFWQKKIFVLLGLIFCVCLVVSGLLRGQSKSLAVSQPPKKVVTLSLVGHFDGMIQSVAITNTTAYLGDDHSLVMLDVSDPANPLEIVRATEIVTDTISAIDLDGNYVYLAAGLAGMAIVDFSSSPSPEIVGQLYGLNSTERMDNLVVITDTVYLSESDYSYGGRDGKIIVDVTTPSNPQEIGFYPSGRNNYRAGVLAVTDSHLISSPWFGLDIIDVSIQSLPVLTSHIYTDLGTPEDVAIKDNLVYSVHRPYPSRTGPLDGGLYIYDIADMTAPQKLSRYPHNARDVMVSVVDHYVFYYGIMPNIRMVILNIDDPLHPYRVNQYSLPELPELSSCYDMTISGNYLYLTCREQGLFIYRWDVVELTETFFLPVITHQTEDD